jgi:hypothetical protein
MSNTAIKLKKSGVTGNTPSGLANGELALNFADGKLYYKNSLGGTSYISNQFSFDTINSNNSLILAGSGSDTLSFVAGNNITISTNTTTKTITINASDSSAFGSANSASLYANGAFTAANNALPKTGGTVTGNVTLSTTATMIIQNTRPTTSNSTGALIVDGGLAVKGNTWISGVFTVDGDFSVGNQTTTGNVINNGLVTFTQPTNFTNTNPSTSNTTGGVIVSGGIGVKGNVYAGAIRVQNTTPSVSNTTGALTVAGGVGIRGNLYVGGIFTVDGDFQVGNQNTSGNVYNTGNVTFTQITQFTSNTASTSNSTGAVVVAGGVGIKGNVHTGGIRITGSTSNGITFVDGTKQYTANVGVSIATSAFNHANAAFNASNNSIIPGGSGNAISFAVDRFTANGATTTFNLSVSTSSNTYTTVVVDGIVQHKDTYSILGDVITFDSTFENGANIEVTSTTLSTTSFINRTFVGDGTTNTYTISYNTTANSILVFGNGITQNPLSDYTVSGNNLIFVNPPTNGTIIQVRELAPVVNVTYTIDTTTANIAFDTANAAYTHANAAYNQANTGGSDSWVRTQANNAYDTANSAGLYSNGAFTAANTADSKSTSAGLYANAAFAQANAAYAQANTGGGSTTDSWVRIQANAAFDVANSASLYANGAFTAANTADGKATSAGLYANGAFVVANSAASFADGAFTKANSANVLAQASFDTANSAASFANGAFTTANLKFNSTGGTISGDVNITGNLSITGNTFSTSATQIVANDTLFIMGTGNYSGDILDIGFAGHYNNGTNAHTGLIRDAGTKEWQLFEEYTPEIGANNNINITDGSFKIATLNANVKSTTIAIKGIDLLPYVNSVFDKANSGASFANLAFDQANSAALYANGAFTKANNTLSLTGGTIAGNVIANSFIANNSIYSPIFYSSGGTTNLTLSDIGIVAINSGGQEIKFGASGIESSKGIYGGSYGGNKLSLDNETKLISNRYDTVKIATGTDGTTVNEWSFSNNQLIFPDSTYQNTAFQGVAIDQTSRDTANSGASFANSAFAAANAAFIQANAAFSQANTGGGGSTTDTYARDTANAAFIQANAAFSQANTGGTSLSKAIAMSIVFGF